MNKMVTLGELVKFVLENRKGNAFRDYAELAIASGIKDASEQGTLLYALDKSDQLCGIIVCTEDRKNQLMHVNNFLATQSWVLYSFIKNFIQNWPDFTLTAKRKNKVIHYDTKKLYNKIMKGSI